MVPTTTPSRLLTFWIGTVLFAAIFLATIGSARPEDNPVPARDAQGDPLPRGAVARLGVRNWRHGGDVTFVAFVNEGKEMVSSCGGGVVHVWDAASGREIRRFGEALKSDTVAIRVSRIRGADGSWNRPRQAPQPAVSDDGKRAATCSPNGKIHIWDVPAGTEVRAFASGHRGYPVALTFAPDGSLVSRAAGDASIKCWDSTTGQLRREFNDAANVYVIGSLCPVAISPDDKLMVTTRISYDGKSYGLALQLWDYKDGTELHKLAGATGQGWIVAPAPPAFSPDSKLLVWPRVDNTAAIYDVASGNVVCQLDEGGAERRALRVLFSPDGKTLAAQRPDQSWALVDAVTGKVRKVIGEPSYGIQDNSVPKALRIGFSALAWSADGKKLAQGWGNVIRVWELETGKGNDLSGGHIGEVSAVLVGPDAKSAFTAALDRTVRQWDLTTAKQQRKLDLPMDSIGTQLLSSRRSLVRSADGSARLWDLVRGKELLKIDGAGGPGGSRNQLAASAGGRVLALAGAEKSIHLVDLETGNERNAIEDVKGGWPGSRNLRFVQAMAISQDSCSVALILHTQEIMALPAGSGAVTKYLIRLYDTENGRVLWEVEAPSPQCYVPTFSPDGHDLAFVDVIQGVVRVLESATGKERCRFSAASSPLAFSPDGRFLAITGAAGTIKILDLAASKEISELPAQESRPRSLAFSRDCSTLVSGGADGTALVWDIREPIRQAGKATDLDEETAARLWTDLAGDDAAKAHRAKGRLASSPRGAVDWVKDHLKPAKGGDPAQVARWAADLGADEFEVRKKAFEELAKLGPNARPALNKLLTEKPALETAKRAEELLQRLPPLRAALTGNALRQVRAVELLETLASPDACALLQALARGAGGALMTEEAAAALKRLGERQ